MNAQFTPHLITDKPEEGSLRMARKEKKVGGFRRALGLPLGVRGRRGVERRRGAELAAEAGKALAPRGGVHRSAPGRRGTNLRFPVRGRGKNGDRGDEIDDEDLSWHRRWPRSSSASPPLPPAAASSFFFSVLPKQHF